MGRPMSEVGGYVLAGGKSSRMGRDKALLELAGKSLVQHAVEKLRRIVDEVRILSGDAGLARFAPVVSDLHPGCGPMGGMEAALAHTRYDWNLILPVDVPFLPTLLLDTWVRATVSHAVPEGTRIAMYRVNGMAQPALLMIHRELAPYLTASLARGEYKLAPLLHAAAGDLSIKRGLWKPAVLREWEWGEESRLTAGESSPPGHAWERLTHAQERDRALWFANVNTPEEFALAEEHADALDT